MVVDLVIRASLDKINRFNWMHNIDIHKCTVEPIQAKYSTNRDACRYTIIYYTFNCYYCFLEVLNYSIFLILLRKNGILQIH